MRAMPDTHSLPAASTGLPALHGSAIGILAGGGRLPLMIAESVVARGGQVHIVGIEGEADADIARFPHTWVNWGQIGRMVTTLQAENSGQLVIAGGVRRPDLWKIRPDVGFFTSLPRLVGLLAGGDDSVLTRVVRFFEQKGLAVRGAHEVAPDLLAGTGAIGGAALSEQDRADAGLGFAVRAALGPLDAGQAVVVSRGKVLAVEGAEGTDAMLQRVAALPGRQAGVRDGVLAKGPKPGQELRIDMPAIGPRTVAAAVAAGLSGIAVEQGAVLILDKADAVRAADTAGLAVEGLSGGRPRLAVAASAPPRTGQVIGRVQPNRRDARDIEKGLAAMHGLAPYGTGASVVVARAYILSIEAAEGVSALLQRVGALRQWGVKRRHRVGVLVRRVETEDDAGVVDRLLGEAAAQGLAGVAVMGTGRALAAYGAAARTADAHGVFLVTCGEPCAG
jgi:UDP-2,3-diacylglucosamine hydrolase